MDCETFYDPEILHGRWLMGWLPIVNYVGGGGDDPGGGGWLIMVDVSDTTLHKILDLDSLKTCV